MVGHSMVGIKADGLVVGGKGLLVFPGDAESITLFKPRFFTLLRRSGSSWWYFCKLSRFLTSFLCLLRSVESIESIAFAIVGIGMVGVEADDLLVSDQSLLVSLEVVESMAFAIVGKDIVE